eukprot:jgi/Psemu1/46302/gm1.46302_g
MGRSKQGRPIKRRRVLLEADESLVAEEQTAFANPHHGEGEEELAKAIELLRKTPQDRVEAAAAEATRLDLTRKDRWIHLRLPALPSSSTTITSATVFTEAENDAMFDTSGTMINSAITPVDETPTIHAAAAAAAASESNNNTVASSVPLWLGGLGFARLATEDYVAFQKLHQTIKDRVNNNHKDKSEDSLSSSSNLEWASWSGSVEDPRKRAFGFLPGTWGYDPHVRNNRLDITMPANQDTEDVKDDERQRNKRAMVVLGGSEVPDGVREAIENLCRVFREALLEPRERKATSTSVATGSGDIENDDYRHKLARFLRYEYLIAAQPNLHSGRALLPVHLDDPRKDGFGVVIVTIGMEGSGTILLRDSHGVKHGVAMMLEEGEAYMLSENARDACAHGVLAEIQRHDNAGSTCCNRESLNLRFGLHDVAAPLGRGDPGGSALSVIPSSNVFRHWEEHQRQSH